jgi:hypothetical protein
MLQRYENILKRVRFEIEIYDFSAHFVQKTPNFASKTTKNKSKHDKKNPFNGIDGPHDADGPCSRCCQAHHGC